MSEPDYQADRQLRDRARILFQDSLARVQEDRGAAGLTRRTAQRMADGAAGMAEDALEMARGRRGRIAIAAIAATGAAAALWLARRPVTQFISRYSPWGHNEREDTQTGNGTPLEEQQ